MAKPPTGAHPLSYDGWGNIGNMSLNQTRSFLILLYKNGFCIHPLLVSTSQLEKCMPATPYPFTSPGKKMSHGGAQITTQYMKCISSSLSVGRVDRIERKRAMGGIYLYRYLLRTLPKKTISTALAESLQLLNFTTYSAQPSLNINYS